jgi:nitrogenase molybdenum-iron protein alpha/beta subunit
VFWKEVPKKVSKAQSKKIYEKLIKDKVITELELIDKIKEYAEYVKGKEHKYILHPSTWLNQRRFFDELEIQNKKVGYENNWLM